MAFVSYEIDLPDSTTLKECDMMLYELSELGLDIEPDGEVWILFSGYMHIEFDEDDLKTTETDYDDPTDPKDIENWIVKKGFTYRKERTRE